MLVGKRSSITTASAVLVPSVLPIGAQAKLQAVLIQAVQDAATCGQCL